MMSSYIAMPYEGQLQQVYYIFAYFRQQHHNILIFDPTLPVIDEDGFEFHDWRYVYGNLSKGMRHNALKALGKIFDELIL